MATLAYSDCCVCSTVVVSLLATSLVLLAAAEASDKMFAKVNDTPDKVEYELDATVALSVDAIPTTPATGEARDVIDTLPKSTPAATAYEILIFPSFLMLS